MAEVAQRAAVHGRVEVVDAREAPDVRIAPRRVRLVGQRVRLRLVRADGPTPQPVLEKNLRSMRRRAAKEAEAAAKQAAKRSEAVRAPSGRFVGAPVGADPESKMTNMLLH